jgi:hypothetical protein
VKQAGAPDLISWSDQVSDPEMSTAPTLVLNLSVASHFRQPHNGRYETNSATRKPYKQSLDSQQGFEEKTV